MPDIRIGTLNVRGLAAAADEVAADVVDAGLADVLVVTETKMRPDTAYPHQYVVLAASEPLPDDDLAAGRPGRGGVAVMAHPRLHRHIHPVEVDDGGRFVVFTVGDWIACGMYLRPELLRPDVAEALAALERARRLHPERPILWCGDLNGRHQERLGDTATNPRGRQLACGGLDALGLHLLNPHGRWTFYRPQGLEQPAGGSVPSRPGDAVGWQRSIIDWVAVDDAGLTRLCGDVHVGSMAESIAGSDHRLVTVGCQVRTQPPGPPPVARHRWHVDRLATDTAVAVAYGSVAPAALSSAADRAEALASGSLPTQSDRQAAVDAAHGLLLTGLTTSADATLGRRPPARPARTHRWFWDQELCELARERRQRFGQLTHATDPAARAWLHSEWRRLDRAIKKGVRARKRAAYHDFISELGARPHHELARSVRLINRARNQRASGLPGDPATVQAVENHFRTAFAGVPAAAAAEPDDLPLPSLDGLPDADAEALPAAFSLEAVQAALKRTPRKKAAGQDGIPPELLRAADIAPALSRFFRLYARLRCVPDAWRRALICPIYKQKGSSADPANYRPIALLSITRKVFETCLLAFLRARCRPLSPLQGGFQPKRGTLDQVAGLLELQRLQRQRRQQAHLAFLDIKGAYDTVARDRLWRKCARQGVQRAAMDLLMGLFDAPLASVLVGRAQTAAFPCAAGVQQGSSLSPWLYTVFVDDLIGALVAGGHGISLDGRTRGAGAGSRVPCLFYADDIALTGRSRCDLAAMLDGCTRHAAANRYRFGLAKCAVLVDSLDPPPPEPPLQLAGQPVPLATTYTYLGLPITNAGVDTAEWQRRALRRARGAVASLRRLGLHRRGFNWRTGIYLYKTFVRPCMEYGAALFRPTKSLFADLDRLQLAVLRDATRGRSTTSHGVLLRLAGCPDMRHRARELAAAWIARAEHATDDRAIYWFWRTARTRRDWNESIFGRVSRGNRIIGSHREDARQRRRPPPDIIRARVIRNERTAWWLDIRRQALERARRNGTSTLTLGLPRLFYPIPLLRYHGPDWVTGLLLLWWTGRLPYHDSSANCIRCGNGHRSRVHIIACHSIRRRLWHAGLYAGDCTVSGVSVHPLDRALQRLSLSRYSLEDRRFHAVMSILREVADVDARARRLRATGAHLPPPPPQPGHGTAAA